MRLLDIDFKGRLKRTDESSNLTLCLFTPEPIGVEKGCVWKSYAKKRDESYGKNWAWLFYGPKTYNMFQHGLEMIEGKVWIPPRVYGQYDENNWGGGDWEFDLNFMPVLLPYEKMIFKAKEDDLELAAKRIAT